MIGGLQFINIIIINSVCEDKDDALNLNNLNCPFALQY